MTIDSLGVLCAPLTRDLFAIAKLLFILYCCIVRYSTELPYIIINKKLLS